MIAATDKNIESVVEKLCIAGRELELSEIGDPVLVLLASSKNERNLLVNIFGRYFEKRFGNGTDVLLFQEYTETHYSSIFNLPNLRTKLMILDSQ